MRATRPTLAAFGLGVLLWGCTGGSGTETTGGSKVLGRVIYADGTAASGAGISVRPSGYLHDSSLADDTVFRADAFATAKGAYKLDSLAPGTYVMEIRDDRGNATMAEFTKTKDGLEMAPIILRKAGILEGRLGNLGGAPDRGYVQVVGLRRVVRADADGIYRIQNLPSGRFQLRVISSRAHWGYRDSLAATIASDETTKLAPLVAIAGPDESYADWSHSRVLTLNTDAVGVDSNVVDFPLLVRLNSGNFDFSQSGGSDLRFADADGTHLAYAVEKWDAAAKTAVAWVHMDTIRGKSTDQTITMHWGQPGAEDRTDSKSVFSTFAGVWHLSDSAPLAGAPRFKDASPTGADGTGSVLAGDNQGTVAEGRAFQGAEGIQAAAVPALKPPFAVTLSAWIRSTGTDSMGSVIVGLGRTYRLALNDSGHACFHVKPNLVADTVRLCVHEADLRDSLWHYISASFDGIDLRLFLDGGEKVSTGKYNGLEYEAGEEFWIGKRGGSSFFDYYGNLDEIQVSPVNRSHYWHQLSFYSQKMDAIVVEFK